MTKRTSGAHSSPRRPLSGSHEEFALWDRAADHSDGASWAEWARGVLTDAAADELGLDPVTLRKVG